MPEEFTNGDLMTALLSVRDAMDHGFAKVDARLYGVETRLTSLEGEVRGVKDEVRAIKDWTQQVDQRFEAIAQAARVTGP